MGPTIATRRRRQRGISLIEIMVVVSILGTLAAVAIPSYIGYRRRAQTAEAMTSLGSMYRAAAGYYEMTFARRRRSTGSGDNVLNRCTVRPTPRIPARPSDQRVLVEWSENHSFRDLGWAVAEPVYYGYQIRSGGRCGNVANRALYTFRARGDLDGDGQMSLFEIAAASDTQNNLRHGGVYRTRALE